MERRCTICRIVAWTAIALGVLIVVLTLQSWAWLVLLGCVLIGGGILLLRC